MHIGIDARELVGRRTGVGRYLAALCAAWQRLPSDAPFEFTLYAQLDGRSPALLGPPFENEPAGRFSYQAVPGNAGALWEQTQLATAINQSPPDVLFAPAYTAPLFTRVPTVLTIHDVSWEAHPEWFTWREGLRRRWLTRHCARHVERVIAVSNFTRDEIVTHLSVPPARISVIWSGIQHPPPSPGLTREPIVLFVGSLFNRRHVPELIAAFARVVVHNPAARLVLVGENRTHPREDPERLASTLGIRSRVSIRQYIDETELSALYARAMVFVFLSEYEGFGFPPLEAMAAGVPSIVGDTPVARELYGDAAVRVDVRDVDAITNAIIELLNSPSARRARLDVAAERLPHFTWTRAASQTLTILEQEGRRR